MPAGATPCVGHGETRTPFLGGESLAAPAKRQRAGAASARRSGAGVFGERFGAMPLAERSQESCYKGSSSARQLSTFAATTSAWHTHLINGLWVIERATLVHTCPLGTSARRTGRAAAPL